MLFIYDTDTGSLFPTCNICILTALTWQGTLTFYFLSKVYIRSDHRRSTLTVYVDSSLLTCLLSDRAITWCTCPRTYRTYVEHSAVVQYKFLFCALMNWTAQRSACTCTRDNACSIPRSAPAISYLLFICCCVLCCARCPLENFERHVYMFRNTLRKSAVRTAREYVLRQA